MKSEADVIRSQAEMVVKQFFSDIRPRDDQTGEVFTCSLLDWMGLVAAELGATLLC